MSSILWKSFNLCFSKFCLPTVKFADDHERLYDQKSFSSTSTTAEDFFSSSSAAEDSGTEHVPNFASALASQRFFFSTPGSSNSIFEPMNVQEVPSIFLSGGVAIQKYSPDPYADFHNSIQEMIQAHELMDVESGWEFLHQLLCCYLTLNPKHTHKFIVDAFADVILSLAASPGTCRTALPRGHCTAPPPVA